MAIGDLPVVTFPDWAAPERAANAPIDVTLTGKWHNRDAGLAVRQVPGVILGGDHTFSTLDWEEGDFGRTRIWIPPSATALTGWVSALINLQDVGDPFERVGYATEVNLEFE